MNDTLTPKEVSPKEQLDSMETRVAKLQEDDCVILVTQAGTEHYPYNKVWPITITMMNSEVLYIKTEENAVLKPQERKYLAARTAKRGEVIPPHRLENPPFEKITPQDMAFGDLVLTETSPGLWVPLRVYNHLPEFDDELICTVSSADGSIADLRIKGASQKTYCLVEKYESPHDETEIQQTLERVIDSGVWEELAIQMDEVMFFEQEDKRLAETGEPLEFYIETMFQAIEEGQPNEELQKIMAEIRDPESQVRKVFYSYLAKSPQKVISGYSEVEKIQARFRNFQTVKKDWPEGYDKTVKTTVRDIRKRWDTEGFTY